MPIDHVLLDADGVMQSFDGDWRGVLEADVGTDVEAFVRELEVLELPLVTSKADILPGLAELLRRHGVASAVEDFYARVWQRIRLDPDSAALVGRIRAGGQGVHLVTNQHARRAAYMRAQLGYDALFDRCFFSCDLGLAKPDPAYFAAVLDQLGARPDRTVVVDDHEPNVAAARRSGLRAVCWTLDEGHEVLRNALAGHGVAMAG